MKRCTGILLGGTMMALWVTPALGQDSTIHSRSNLSVASSANMERIPPKQGISDEDRYFIMSMAKVHMAEIQCAEIAQRNGGEWSQAYGKDMAREHNLALEELRKIAQTYTVLSMPTDVDTITKRAMNRLNRLQGESFDAAYKQMMIQGHSQVLTKVQDEIRSGHNSDVRGYAVTLEPSVKLHLKMAQQQTTMMGKNAG